MNRCTTIKRTDKTENRDVHYQLLHKFFEYYLNEDPNDIGTARGVIVNKMELDWLNDFKFTVKKINNDDYLFEYINPSESLTDHELYEISIILIDKIKNF